MSLCIFKDNKHLPNSYYGLDTMHCALKWTHFNLTLTLPGRYYYYPHLIDQETEVKKVEEDPIGCKVAINQCRLSYTTVTASSISQWLTLTKVCFLLMLMNRVIHVWLCSNLSCLHPRTWTDPQRAPSIRDLANHQNTEKREHNRSK